MDKFRGTLSISYVFRRYGFIDYGDYFMTMLYSGFSIYRRSPVQSQTLSVIGIIMICKNMAQSPLDIQISTLQ